MNESHSHRTAIVTGASRGIGRGIAVALGEVGFNVAINYHRNEAAAQACAALVKDAGGQAAMVQADVSEADGRQKLLNETLDTFGDINLLVNNAGIAPTIRADLLETAEESYDQLMKVNLKGPFFLTQLVASHMITCHDGDRTNRQTIINISSISAYTASVNRGEYCISKAGMTMMTQLFATRLAEYGIAVHEIRPGIIATDMTGPVKEKYDKLIHEDGLLPFARWGQPQDIGKTVVAIVQGALPYCTGQVINLDGGFHLRTL